MKEKEYTKIVKSVNVKAKPGFYRRRLITIPLMQKKEFRKLKSGEIVNISKEIYERNKTILEEVK